jgi:outer membrane protein assembly factor BamB
MKDKYLGLLLAILLSCSVTPVAEAAYHVEGNCEVAGGDDWPMYRHDLKHTGYSPDSAPQSDDLVWTTTLNSPVKSSPSIVNNRLFVGSTDENIYCLDALEGTALWNFTTGGMVYSSPAIYEEKLYCGSLDGNLYCLDTQKGTHLWNFSTGSSISFSSPAVINDKVYFGSVNNKVYCLDAQEGTVLWNFTIGGAVLSSPAVVNNRVYVGSTSGKLYCLDATNGYALWNYTTGPIFFSSPVINGNNVYVGSTSGKVYCLWSINGTEQWNHSNGGLAISSSLAFAYEKVYVSTIHHNNGYDLYCLDAEEGEMLWNTTAGGSLLCAPSLADGKLFVGSDSNGVVSCFDAEDGTQIWNYSTGDVVSSSPSIAEGNLYVCSENGTLFCFGETNQPPSSPVFITAPVAGGSEISLNFSVTSSDPEGDEVFYKWNWGDGNESNWLGPFASDQVITVNHSWFEEGDYEIQVRARDVFYQENGIPAIHMISIAPQIELSNILPGYIYLRLLSFNQSFAYIYLLEALGASILIVDEPLYVEVTAEQTVASVKFELHNLIWDDYLFVEDEDSSYNFSGSLEADTGIWELSVYAYDSEETLIDSDHIDYLILLNTASNEERELGRIGAIFHHLTERFLNK